MNRIVQRSKVCTLSVANYSKMTTLNETTNVWKPQDHVPEELQNILSKKHPNYVLAFLNIVQQLKLQKRTGWLDHNITPCESISDHMYRMGVTSMMIKDPKVNRDKCVRIALVHDIAEALVGDITPFDGVSKEEKHRREWETIQYLCQEFIRPYNEIAAKEIMEHWLEYENISSLEARYTKDIDKYEMLVQAFEYEREYGSKVDLNQFWSAMSSIKTDEVKGWADDLYKLREEMLQERKI